jgi:hypothetical protein
MSRKFLIPLLTAVFVAAPMKKLLYVLIIGAVTAGAGGTAFAEKDPLIDVVKKKCYDNNNKQIPCAMRVAPTGTPATKNNMGVAPRMGGGGGGTSSGGAAPGGGGRRQ